MVALAAPLCATLAFVPPLSGQSPSGPAPPVSVISDHARIFRAPQDEPIQPPSWVAPVASAFAPGTGQLLVGKDRGLLYLVAEAFFLGRFLVAQGEGVQQRKRYRTLAFVVARAPFAPTVRDTAFGYFEQMGKFTESGPFDSDPGPALVPAADVTTFNGHIWALAKRTFFPDPDAPPEPDSDAYRRAETFYVQRAIGPNFTWSWTGAQEDHERYRQAISKSDGAFRRRSRELGFLLANHLLSSVDAIISNRLSRAGRRASLRTVLWMPPGPAATPVVAWNVRITF